MRGQFRKVLLERRVIIDLMHAARKVPFVSLRRTLVVKELAAARAGMARPPAWAAIFAKAFALVAREQPLLRTVYMKWPWPHFYEFDKSVAMIVVAPKDVANGVLFFKITAPDTWSLAGATQEIRRSKLMPRDSIPFFRKTMRVTRLPFPLRRILWWIGLNIGRQHGNYFGSIGITSVAAFGGGEGHTLSPGPYILCYDNVTDAGTIDVVIRWDHRVTDAGMIGLAMSRLEKVLNGELAAELRAEHDAAPERTVEPVH